MTNQMTRGRTVLQSRRDDVYIGNNSRNGTCNTPQGDESAGQRKSEVVQALQQTLDSLQAFSLNLLEVLLRCNDELKGKESYCRHSLTPS